MNYSPKRLSLPLHCHFNPFPSIFVYLSFLTSLLTVQFVFYRLKKTTHICLCMCVYETTETSSSSLRTYFSHIGTSRYILCRRMSVCVSIKCWMYFGIWNSNTEFIYRQADEYLHYLHIHILFFSVIRPIWTNESWQGKVEKHKSCCTFPPFSYEIWRTCNSNSSSNSVQQYSSIIMCFSYIPTRIPHTYIPRLLAESLLSHNACSREHAHTQTFLTLLSLCLSNNDSIITAFYNLRLEIDIPLN